MKQLTIYSDIENPVVSMYNKNTGKRYTSNSSLLSDSVLYYKENTSHDYLHYFKSSQYAVSLNIQDDYYFDSLLNSKDSIVKFDGIVLDNEGKIEVDGVSLPRREANKLAFTVSLLSDNTIHKFDTDEILTNRSKYLRANSKNKLLKYTIGEKRAETSYLTYRDMVNECLNKKPSFSTYNVNKFIDKEEVVSPYDLTFRELEEHILPVSKIVRYAESDKFDSITWGSKYLISKEVFCSIIRNIYVSNKDRFVYNLTHKNGYIKQLLNIVLTTLNMSIVKIRDINPITGKCYCSGFNLVDKKPVNKNVGAKKSILSDLRALLVDFDNQNPVYVFTFAKLISKALGVQVAVENTNPSSSNNSYHVILKLVNTPLLHAIRKSDISYDAAVSCIDGVIDYCVYLTNKLFSSKSRYFNAALSLKNSGVDAIIEPYDSDRKLVRDDTVSSKLHAGVILGPRLKRSKIKKLTVRKSRIDAIFTPIRDLNTVSFNFVRDLALEHNSDEVVEKKVKNFKMLLKGKLNYNLKFNPVEVKDSSYNIHKSDNGNIELNGVRYSVSCKDSIPNRQSYEAVALDIIIKSKLSEIYATKRYNELVKEYEEAGKKIPNKSKLNIANPDTVYEYTINSGINSIAKLPISKLDRIELCNLVLSNSGVKFKSDYLLDNTTTLEFRQGSVKTYERLTEADVYNLIISDIITGNASYQTKSLRQGSIKKVVDRLEKIGIIKRRIDKVGKLSYTKLLLNSKIHIAQLLTLLSSKYINKIIIDKRYSFSKTEEDVLKALSDWYKETMIVSKIAKSKDVMTISMIKTMYSFMIFTESCDKIYDILKMVFSINSKKEYMDVEIETFEGEILSYEKYVEIDFPKRIGVHMSKSEKKVDYDTIDDIDLSKLAESWGISDYLDENGDIPEVKEVIRDEKFIAEEKKKMEEAMKPHKIKKTIEAYIRYAKSSIESHKLAAKATKEILDDLMSDKNSIKSNVAIVGQKKVLNRHLSLIKANKEVLEECEKVNSSIEEYIDKYTHLEFERFLGKLRSSIVCKHIKK